MGEELAIFIKDARDGPPAVRVIAQSKLDAAPPIESDDVFYYRAFQELGTDRPPAMSGICQIPISAMRAYCDEYEMYGIERQQFYAVLREMDTHYCNAIRANQDKQSPPK